MKRKLDVEVNEEETVKSVLNNEEINDMYDRMKKDIRDAQEEGEERLSIISKMSRKYEIGRAIVANVIDYQMEE